MNIIARILKNPQKLRWTIIHRKLVYLFARFYSDRKFLEALFPLRTGYALNLNNPQTFNEKLQWLKLYDRQPEYTMMVDKAEVKKWVAEKIGNEYVIPTIAVWDKVEDIDWGVLPHQFVLKCTHDSGGIVICKDKAKLDKKTAIKKMSRGLKRHYFIENREWPYKNVPHRIIAEEYKEDESGNLNDYKWFCFDGEPKAMFIATDRFTPGVETKFDFYDMNFNHLPFTNGHPNTDIKIKKPKGFEEMKRLAAILSKGIPHVRVDFYDINGRIYFGELTFFHWSGMKPFEPKEWDFTFGKWIQIPN